MKYPAVFLLTTVLTGANLTTKPLGPHGAQRHAAASAVTAANLNSGAYFTGQGARMIVGQATFTDARPGTSDRMLGAAGGVAYANDTLFIADSSRFSDTTPQNRRGGVYQQGLGEVPAPLSHNS